MSHIPQEIVRLSVKDTLIWVGSIIVTTLTVCVTCVVWLLQSIHEIEDKWATRITEECATIRIDFKEEFVELRKNTPPPEVKIALANHEHRLDRNDLQIDRLLDSTTNLKITTELLLKNKITTMQNSDGVPIAEKTAESYGVDPG